MSSRAVMLVTVFVVGSTFLLAWLFSWPLVRAGLLAPVVVAVTGILAFWGLVALRSLHDASRPRQAVAVAVVVLVILVIAQVVVARAGIDLPHEGF